MIRYLWFDLGYTLVRTNREEVYQKVLLERFDVFRNADEIAIAYHRTDKLFMREFQGVLGKDSRAFLPWYIGTLNYFLRLALPIEEVTQAYRALAQEWPIRWKAYEGARQTLQHLRSLGFRLGLISNWDESARTVLAQNGLDAELDDIIVSSEVGVEKPNPDIFRLAMDRANVTANECLYIGDNYYDDVIGSQKIGMHCLLINAYGNRGVEELSYYPIISGIHDVAAYLGHPRVPQEINR
ncbi:HAD family hydrolase [Paenibacillus mesophilus]|uniref:HAD family hydrolase n=1 Tax=Paenibacillus mesophilus TaxID=2582849 RepID=UPI00110D37A8|nr:HAD-IA family hydrolase [Paenibacillus mesophilus]TMV49114.1 HAD family hydrolase [Paenibacillus mesophilus]